MDKFMQCLCDDDLTVLVLEGNPTAVQIESAWIKIISEYQELRGDTVDMIEAIRLTKNIRRTQHHLMIFEECIKLLGYRWSTVAAESLCELGYFFKPKTQNPLEYVDDLMRCVNASRQKTFFIQRWIKELKALPPNTSKPSRHTFEATLVAIEEIQHVAYALETMTVSKFLMLEKRLNQYVQKWQSKG